MSLMIEYQEKIKNDKWNNSHFEKELLKLIKKYNKYRDSYLFVFSTDFNKRIIERGINQDDYYFIFDLLRNCESKKIDFYIETPGGSGEATESIVKFLHSKFDTVSFIISGEAKSAGTIMALSGDEIYMTETGSLGPIDAQMQIGRFPQSSSDYKIQLDKIRKEAITTGRLNPVDAQIVAQITPGELRGVLNAHDYSARLVKEWLFKYKFRNWSKTKTRGIDVTDDMKRKRAEEIVDDLSLKEKWGSHGTSININDLHDLGLEINRIEDDFEFANIVNRIQVVIRYIFTGTNAFKIYATETDKLFKNITVGKNAPQLLTPLQQIPKDQIGAANFDVRCNNCGHIHKLYIKLKNDKKIDDDMKKKKIDPFPKNNFLVCKNCKAQIDLHFIKKDIENSLGIKTIS